MEYAQEDMPLPKGARALLCSLIVKYAQLEWHGEN